MNAAPDSTPQGTPSFRNLDDLTPEEASALLDRARSGDRAALSTLLASVERTVYRFGVRMCGHPEDAQEVLQETLLAAARSVADYRGEASFSTWLFTIARSFCIKRRRRVGPAELLSLDDDSVRDQADPSESPDEEAERRQLRDRLKGALATLEDGQREVLILRDVEGMTAPEVGAALGLSIEAVKSRLHRARNALRQRLATVVPPPPSEACPDIGTLFSQHLEGDIDASTCQAMEKHLAGCPRCRANCDELRQTLSLCRTTAPGRAVPKEVQASVRRALAPFLVPERMPDLLT